MPKKETKKEGMKERREKKPQLCTFQGKHRFNEFPLTYSMQMQRHSIQHLLGLLLNSPTSPFIVLSLAAEHCGRESRTVINKSDFIHIISLLVNIGCAVAYLQLSQPQSQGLESVCCHPSLPAPKVFLRSGAYNVSSTCESN